MLLEVTKCNFVFFPIITIFSNIYSSAAKNTSLWLNSYGFWSLKTYKNICILRDLLIDLVYSVMIKTFQKENITRKTSPIFYLCFLLQKVELSKYIFFKNQIFPHFPTCLSKNHNSVSRLCPIENSGAKYVCCGTQKNENNLFWEINAKWFL